MDGILIGKGRRLSVEGGSESIERRHKNRK